MSTASAFGEALHAPSSAVSFPPLQEPKWTDSRSSPNHSTGFVHLQVNGIPYGSITFISISHFFWLTSSSLLLAGPCATRPFVVSGVLSGTRGTTVDSWMVTYLLYPNSPTKTTTWWRRMSWKTKSRTSTSHETDQTHGCRMAKRFLKRTWTTSAGLNQ